LDDPWVALFALADHTERVQRDKCELVPYWYVDAHHFKIERIIPLYPFSRDHGKLAAILKTLAIYRLAFGQPRQVELIEHLLQKNFSPDEIALIREKLMIDLSPISYGRAKQNGRAYRREMETDSLTTPLSPERLSASEPQP
jgi:hypothetical protein